MKRMLVALGAVCALALGLGLGSTERADAVSLSPVGERAFEDVTTCLTSGREKSLDVYYLIDQSGSLEWTDPNNAREGIIRNSVSELGRFVDQGISVGVAASGFGAGVIEFRDWTQLESRDDAAAIGAQLSADVVSQYGSGNYRNNTNWQAGLSVAKEKLAERPDSCRMLIWFTDGGINPTGEVDDATASLGALCQPGITTGSIPSGPGPFGLMQEFRSANIPVFGVLLTNESESLDRFQQTYPGDWEERLALEKWLSSFMKPLVEGRGSVSNTSALAPLAEGELTCAEIDGEGFAPPGQANGAFIDAADPVLLAYQFLRIGGQISGGAGSSIENGQFVVPQGTAGFELIVSSDQWSLSGPEDSGISVSPGSPGQARVDSSGGASRIQLDVGDQDELVGQWAFETTAEYADLFLFSGLTMELDRDRVSTILSDFDNTLTGRVVRTAEYSALPVDLSRFSQSNFSLSILEDGQRVNRPIEIQLADNGQFIIEKFNPGDNAGTLDLWLTLDIGPEFESITSQFDLSIVDKSAMATPETDFIELTALEGPDGVATGTLAVVGPNVSDSSTFCISREPLRLDDSQAKGDQPVERSSGFAFSFAGTQSTPDGNCIEVQNGETASVTIEARNPTQANARVVSSWQVTSTAPTTAAAFDAPISVQFDSITQTNRAVEWASIALLLVLGLLLPLGIMWLANFFQTRFLPIESTMAAEIPVSLAPDSRWKITRKLPDGSTGDLVIGADDFKNRMDQKAQREYDTGRGIAQGRVPWFPLAATWYEWQAPAGHRIVSIFDSGNKSTPQMATGHAAEVSPNMAKNWALVVSEADLRRESADAIDATLLVFAPMGSLNSYQERVRDIVAAPGLPEKLDAVRESTQTASETEGVDAAPVSVNTGTQSTPPGFTPSDPSPNATPPGAPPAPPRSGPLAPPPPPPSS